MNFNEVNANIGLDCVRVLLMCSTRVLGVLGDFAEDLSRFMAAPAVPAGCTGWLHRLATRLCAFCLAHDQLAPQEKRGEFFWLPDVLAN